MENKVTKQDGTTYDLSMENYKIKKWEDTLSENYKPIGLVMDNKFRALVRSLNLEQLNKLWAYLVLAPGFSRGRMRYLNRALVRRS
jgi:hypothetical protein